MLKNLLEKYYNEGCELKIKLGKLKIVKTSNIKFYEQFINNFEDFRPYFEGVTNEHKGENQG